MSETKHNCKFFLLRYVPDAVKDEFINIGLVFLPPQAPPELRFTHDWSRVECLNPDADIEFLKAFCDEIAKDNQEKSRELLLKKIAESFSNSLQASEYKACVTTVPAQEVDELARIYLETAQRRPVSERRTGQTIRQQMENAFKETGVWQQMSKGITASDYGIAGDPLKIDCGYGLDSIIKMFHGTPLRTNVNAAKVLAFSYPALAAGIREKKHVNPLLTAIVEDSLEKNEQIGFALHTLEQHGIQVATVSQLPDLALTAARELGILP